MTTNYTLAIVGSHGSGKTTFVNRHFNGEFLDKTAPDVRRDSNLGFYTTHGDMLLRIIEVRDLVEIQHEKIDGCILFCDLGNRTVSANMIKNNIAVRPKIPKVICWNKADIKENTTRLSKVQTFGHETYLISAKSNYNFEKPFLYLLRKLTGNESLELIADSE